MPRGHSMTAATRLTAAPAVQSRPEQARRLGGRMDNAHVLDIIEQLLRAAQHPDILHVERYGPGLGAWGPTVRESAVKTITGVRVIHQSTATASLWDAVWPGEQPIDPPRVMPPPRQNRAPRLLIFTAQLLDTARPDGLKAWRLVTLPQLGDPGTQAGLPFGLSIIAGDGRRVLLRATATGPTVGAEPDEEPFPDYVIPEGVRTCLRAGAANAGR